MAFAYPSKKDHALYVAYKATGSSYLALSQLFGCTPDHAGKVVNAYREEELKDKARPMDVERRDQELHDQTYWQMAHYYVHLQEIAEKNDSEALRVELAHVARWLQNTARPI